MTKTIMVVDDEPDVRLTIKKVLEKNKYKVIEASNGDDCLEKLQKIKPDLILMDIMMPGTELMEIIPKIKDIKILYLSVVKEVEATKAGLLNQENIVGYFQKPFQIDLLIQKVNEILGE